MNYKIISSDLDGTLLNNEMKVSEENRLAIREYVDMGGVFVPNSGRSIDEISDEVKNLPGVRYLIGSDGSDIYDKETGEHIGHGLPMTREEAAIVFDLLDDYETLRAVHYQGASYLDADRFDRESMAYCNVDEYFAAHFEATARTVGNYEAFCRGMEEVEMVCAFFHSIEELDECRRRAREAGFQVAETAEFNIEIFSPRAGKGNALLRLAQHLGVAREETIAIGDSTNDSSMLKAAGLGLAMENACDELKAIADAVVCRNTEHVVPYLLKHYIH